MDSSSVEPFFENHAVCIAQRTVRQSCLEILYGKNDEPYRARAVIADDALLLSKEIFVIRCIAHRIAYRIRLHNRTEGSR